jgi:dihydrofolate reductase
MAPKTTYLTAMSLDGFIATEDNDLSWLFQLEGEDPEAGPDNPYTEFIDGVGAMAMGATTYEWVMEHEDGRWPYTLPTWVFTHRDLPVPDGGAVRLTSEPAVEVHRQMVEAAAGKDVWLVGGGDLVGQFLDHDLLDEIWVSIAPLVLGRGAPLLPRRRTEPMRVLEVRHAAGGPFVHVHYSLR